MLTHIQLLTNYNSRLNQQVYDTAALIDHEQLHEDRGAFFKSINATLNHILIADILWLGRFYKAFSSFPGLSEVSQFEQPTGLADVIYSDFGTLVQARQRMDIIISNWVMNDLADEDLDQDLTYTNIKGELTSRNFGEVILHVFNHHTHHRGQVSTLLFQLGEDVGVTDFLFDIPEN